MVSIRTSVRLIGPAMLALAAAGPAHGVTYDLAADWSDAANPNGVWSYGTGLAHYAQPVTPNALNSAAANGYWGTGPDFFSVPFTLKTTANGASTGAYTDNDFLAGDVLVHGPNDGSSVAVNWTAPGAGTISFNSAVWYAHSIVSRPQDIAAFLNTTSLGGVTVMNGVDRPNALTTLSGNGLAVAAGDVLSFRFTKTAGQTFGSVSGIDLAIDFQPGPAVPEPATWALMILGFGAAGAAVRRRGATVAHA